MIARCNDCYQKPDEVAKRKKEKKINDINIALIGCKLDKDGRGNSRNLYVWKCVLCGKEMYTEGDWHTLNS